MLLDLDPLFWNVMSYWNWWAVMNIWTQRGCTPLHNAAMGGDKKIMDLLLAANADPQANTLLEASSVLIHVSINLSKMNGYAIMMW